jgi:hypothetical protein
VAWTCIGITGCTQCTRLLGYLQDTLSNPKWFFMQLTFRLEIPCSKHIQPRNQSTFHPKSIDTLVQKFYRWSLNTVAYLRRQLHTSVLCMFSHVNFAWLDWLGSVTTNPSKRLLNITWEITDIHTQKVPAVPRSSHSPLFMEGTGRSGFYWRKKLQYHFRATWSKKFSHMPTSIGVTSLLAMCHDDRERC